MKCRAARGVPHAVCDGADGRCAGSYHLCETIAGGFPLAGVTGRAEVMDASLQAVWAAPMPVTRLPAWQRGSVKGIRAGKSAAKSQRPGDKLKDGLLAIAEKHPEIGDVAGWER